MKSLRALLILSVLALMAFACSTLAQAASPSSNVPPTWARDVAPLVYKNCSTCHHPGGGGPFSLMSYSDAKRWSRQVVAVTQSRFMPPWLPEPGYGDFADERRLSDADRELLKRWVAGGMLEGNPKDAPAAPRYESGWQLGKPDLILEVTRPFTLPAGGTDVFRNLILPYPLQQTRFIRAMEIVPSVPQVVHHANVLIDRTASLRRRHAADWQDGVPGMDLQMDAGNRFDPDSHFLFWKPDSPALIEPEGMPWRLDPGNDLVLNIHLKPSGKPETITARIGLYFTSKPPAFQPVLLQLDRDDALDIPPGDARFVVEDKLTLPVDVKVLGVYPHAHYLGRDMQGWAILPNGEKKWLVWIRDWDINRQSVYRYKTPLPLPRGTTLHMRYTYDNSAANPHNPHDPPVRVRAGNRSEDEMSHLWLQVLPVNTPAGGPDPRLLIEEAWMRNRLAKTPQDRISLYNLAASLAGQGRYAQASATFERLLQMEPKDAHALTALGAALEGAGQWRQAEQQYRAAVEASAASPAEGCDARFNLANLELRHQELNSAESDFRAHLAACADDAEAHAGLGASLVAEGRSAPAEAEFERALQLDPANLAALIALAGIRLDEDRSQEAMQLLSDAVRLYPDSAEAQQQLARAHAQAGDVKQALLALRKAVALKPDDPLTHSALAQVLSATGSLHEAIDEQRKALTLSEDDADGWNNLGALEARAGQPAAARADFEHALRLDPNHAQARANLARLHAQN